ncbi:MAG: NADPH-dependent 7-cyano-7-deazaguanine reductase QueF [Limnohabitans sp.]|nr:NADPH-dependent 7-cyano-7-deazaguanine reductase QueF [Limnohabitans sp.]
MNTPEQSQLGKIVPYVDQYDASLLFPFARVTKRKEIHAGSPLIFMGADLWTVYELSWLNLKGKPVVVIAQVMVPCESTHIIESKSFKLYVNSLSNSKFKDANEVEQLMVKDLNEAVCRGGAMKSSVSVKLIMPEAFDSQMIHEMDGLLLDRLDVDCVQYQPDPQLLKAHHEESPVTEILMSHLLKSNCLVTGQPDWGSVQIKYTGGPIDQEGLLQYIVSYRNHNEFHEQCVERIFMDVWQRCKPIKLEVFARYTRRGGLDINPWRTSHPTQPPSNIRTARQ